MAFLTNAMRSVGPSVLFGLLYSTVPKVPANTDSVLDVEDFEDLTPIKEQAIEAVEDEADLASSEIDIDDFVNIDGSKIEGEVDQKSHIDEVTSFAKSSGLAFVNILVGGAKTLKDIVDLIYNIAYTTYCVAYTCVKIVMVVSKIVLVTGKIVYFVVKANLEVTRMCYRMLTH
jgi:hypothetical protein